VPGRTAETIKIKVEVLLASKVSECPWDNETARWVGDLDEALANDTPYRLSAAIFTQSLQTAMRFAREVDAGNLHVNWGPVGRADLMPYGGLKQSGLRKEGPKYAVEEMTEVKTVIMHGV